MRRLWLVTVFAFAACLGLAATAAEASAPRVGSRGEEVLTLQEDLARLGYFHTAPTGYFGRLTTAALRAFQADMGLVPDAVAGPLTRDALARALRRETGLAQRSAGTVALMPWEQVNALWAIGEAARVYDVDSGLVFLARRLYGKLHADVEPLTSRDTAIMKAIYGGHWSWARRAVVVELNGHLLAGSMNGMPHGGQAVYGNDFDGQFCLHFLGSRVHLDGRLDPEHQAMVLKAARLGLANLAGSARSSAEAPGREVPL